jgi:hypothetical protein
MTTRPNSVLYVIEEENETIFSFPMLGAKD